MLSHCSRGRSRIVFHHSVILMPGCPWVAFCVELTSEAQKCLIFAPSDESVLQAEGFFVTVGGGELCIPHQLFFDNRVSVPISAQLLKGHYALWWSSSPFPHGAAGSCVYPIYTPHFWSNTPPLRLGNFWASGHFCVVHKSELRLENPCLDVICC